MQMKQKPLTKEELRNAIKMYEKGATTKQIGVIYKKTPRNISRELRENGVTLRKVGYVRTVSETEKTQMVELYKQDHSVKKIAKIICRCESTIDKYLAERGIEKKMHGHNLTTTCPTCGKLTSVELLRREGKCASCSAGR
jgi:IS30 family transposase